MRLEQDLKSAQGKLQDAEASAEKLADELNAVTSERDNIAAQGGESNSLFQKQVSELRSKLDDATSHLDATKKEVAGFKTQQEESASKLEAAQAGEAKLQAEVKKIAAELEESAGNAKKMAATNTELDAKCKTQDAQLRDASAAASKINEANKRLETDVNAAKEQSKAEQSTMSQLKQDMADSEAKIVELKAATKKKIDASKDKLKQATHEAAALAIEHASQLDTVKSKVAAKQTEIRKLHDELDLSVVANKTLTANADKVRAQCKALESKLQQANQDATKQVKTATQMFNDVDSKSKELKQQIKSAESSLADAQTKAKQLTAELKTAQGERDALALTGGESSAAFQKQLKDSAQSLKESQAKLDAEVNKASYLEKEKMKIFRETKENQQKWTARLNTCKAAEAAAQSEIQRMCTEQETSLQTNAKLTAMIEKLEADWEAQLVQTGDATAKRTIVESSLRVELKQLKTESMKLKESYESELSKSTTLVKQLASTQMKLTDSLAAADRSSIKLKAAESKCAEKLETGARLEKELVSSKKDLKDSRNKLVEAKAAADRVSAKLKTAQSDGVSQTENAARLEKDLAMAKKSLKESQSKLTHTQTMIDKLSSKLKIVQSDINVQTEKGARLKKELASTKNNLKDSQNSAETLSTELMAVQTELDTVTSKRDDIKKELSQTKITLKDQSALAEKLSAELKDAVSKGEAAATKGGESDSAHQKQVADLTSRLAIASVSLESVSKEAASFKAEQEEYAAKLEQSQVAESKAQEMITNVTGDLEASNASNEVLTGTIAKLKADHVDLESQLTDAKTMHVQLNDNLQISIENGAKNLELAVQAATSPLLDQIKSLENKTDSLETRRRESVSDASKADDAKARAEKLMTAQTERHSYTLQKLKAELAASRNESADCKAALGRVVVLEKEIKDSHGRCSELESKKARTEKLLAKTEDSSKALMKQVGRMKDFSETTDENNRKLSQEIKSTSDALQDCKSDLETSKREQKQLVERVDELGDEASRLQAGWDTLMREHENLRRNAAETKDKLEDELAMATQSAADLQARADETDKTVEDLTAQLIEKTQSKADMWQEVSCGWLEFATRYFFSFGDTSTTLNRAQREIVCSDAIYLHGRCCVHHLLAYCLRCVLIITCDVALSRLQI